MIRLLLFVLSCHHAFCITEPQLVFVKRNSLVLSEGVWNIVIDIKTEAVTIALDNLQDHLIELNNQTSKFLEHASPFQGQDKSLLKQTTDSLQTDISNLRDRLRNLETPLRSTRRSRALFDGIGKALHYVTGVATDEQVDLLNQRVNELANHETAVNHLIRDQLTYFQKLETRDNQQSNAISYLGHTVNSLSATVSTFINSSQEQLVSLQQQVRIMSTIDSVRSLMLHHLQQLSLEVDRYTICEEAALQGRLSPRLIEPQDFLSSLLQLQSSLPENLALLQYPSKNSIPEFYDMAKTRLVRVGTLLRFIVDIPLKKAGQLFTVYEVVSWPHISQTGLRQLTTSDTPFLAVSSDRLLYIRLQADYSYACQFNSPQYCPGTHTLLGRKAPSCAIALFQNPTLSTTTPFCAHSSEASIHPVFLSESPGRWLYSITDNLTFSIDCKCKDVTRESTWTQLHGQGRLILPPGCIAQSENYILQASPCQQQHQTDRHVEARIEPFHPAIFLDYPSTLPTIQPSPVTFSMMDPIVLKLNNSEEDISGLKQDYENLLVAGNQTSFITPHVIYGTTTSGGVLLLLVIVAITWCSCRSRNHHLNTAHQLQTQTTFVAIPQAEPQPQHHPVMQPLWEPVRCPRDI